MRALNEPTYTGGQSIWGTDFPLEIHSRLRFTHRGLVAMASGKEGNQSQFFTTLAATPQLNGQHTIFGKLTGNAIYNILQVNDLELSGDRPVQPPKILR
jgi:peptidyl-prolyl cis-trans isomerase SDCCAG10